MKKSRNNPYYSSAKNENDARQRAMTAKQKGQVELDDLLDTAIRFRDVLQADALLEQGANPNTADANNASILGHAISSKHIESVTLLLSRGADPNLRTGLGTPVTLATYSEEWEMLQKLLDAGADVNTTGTIRATALHAVVKHSRNPKIVQLLLKHGAKVNVKDAEGLTPVDWAERNGDKAIVQLLKTAGAKSGAKVKATKPSITKLPKKKPVR